MKRETRGRKPRNMQPATRKLSFAVDDTEDEIIRNAARANGLTLSSYLRWRVLGGEPMRKARRETMT